MKLTVAILLLCSCALAQSTFGGYSGGGCGSSSTCTVTMTTNQSVQATFNGSAAFSVTNQQPTTTVFYSGSLWTKPLPADVSSHLAANSDNIVKNVFHNSDSLNNTAYTQSVVALNSGGSVLSTSSFGNGFYYSDSTYPVFKVVGSFTCPGGVNATAANCPSNKYFHLPGGACFDSAPVTSDDQELAIWDQSSDIDATTGGRILSSYHFGTGSRCLPTNCTCTTTACANTTPACQLGSSVIDNFAAIHFPFADSVAWGDGISSDGGAAAATLLREQEVMGGTIKHALGLDTACLAAGGSPVFPATGDALHCSTDTVRPNNGSLFFIDSSYNCDDAAIALWQRPVCHAMQTYGGYVHATAGGTTSQLYVKPMEGGLDFSLLNLTDPFFSNWLGSHAGTLTFDSVNGVWTGGPTINGSPAIKLVAGSSSPSPSTKALLWFFQMPGLITGQGTPAHNDGLVHLHIADPCIAIGLAGLSSFNGTNACN